MIWIFHMALLQTKESIAWHPLDLQILSGISSPRSSWYWSYRTVTWLSKTQLLNLSSGGSCCTEVWSWHGPTQCNKCSKPLINILYPRNSLEVQRLELCAFTAKGSGSIPGCELRSYMLCSVAYVCVCVCVCVCLVAQSCLTLCNPMDCSPPGSSVHGESPGKNTGVSFHALLQGIFPAQGPNPGLPHCR